MTVPPFDVETSLRQHGQSLRVLAGELLRDPAAADDAMQELWLGALRRPPVHDHALGGWLATALRNVARKLRRGDARRAAREAVAAQVAPRDLEVEDHARAAARDETLQQLLAAVAALEAPYHDAVWQRFFEGKAPREIARGRGVSVATVKSWLQRGLAQLRSRLGAKGRDWRAGLAGAFGLAPAVPMAVPAAAAWQGAMLMTTFGKTMAAVAVVAVAGFVVWMLPDPAPLAAPSAAAPAGLVASVSETANPAHVAAPAAAPTPDTPHARVAAAPAPATIGKTATVRGRCVDAAGNPLAGCQVSWSAWERNTQSMDLYRRDHPKPDWKDPPRVTTGADGAFSFSFEPPPPFQFSLFAARATLVPQSARWTSIEPGAAIDVDDLRLMPGVRLSGRVVDGAGAPRPNVYLNVTSRTAPRAEGVAGHAQPVRNGAATSGPDGRFTCHHALLPGPYEMRASGEVEGAVAMAIDLPAGRDHVEVTYVIPLPPAGPTIAGRVVDATGQPVRLARVEYRGPRGSGRSGTGSARDGAFTVRGNAEDAADPVTLHVERDGFELATTPAPIVWGSKDVVVTLERTAGLVVRATDSEGQPIPDYTVRTIPREVTSWSSSDADVRARGPFVDGTATMSQTRRGKYTVVLEFPTASGLPACFEPIEVRGGAPKRCDVVVEPHLRRGLRVVTADGTAVAGTRVQLCDPVEGEFLDHTPVLPLDRFWELHGPKKAIVVAEGITDAAGRCELAGSRRRTYGAHVLGPGHLPVRLAEVRFDTAEDLVVTVQRGARLRGQLGPPEAIAELKRLARAGASERIPRHHRPLIEFWRDGQCVLPSPNARHVLRDDFPFLLGDDGRFDVSGVPAGRWEVRLRYSRISEEGAAGSPDVALGTAALVDGETAELAGDLTMLLPGTLRALVTRNGAPLAGVRVLLKHGNDWHWCRTDGSGRLEYVTIPGRYDVLVFAMAGEREIELPIESPVTVTRGETTEATFAVWSGALALRLLDPDGAPAPGCELVLRKPGNTDDNWFATAADDGWFRSEAAAGAWTVYALPRRMRSAEGKQRAYEEARAAGASYDSLWSKLGELTVASGATLTTELRLPAAWAR